MKLKPFILVLGFFLVLSFSNVLAVYCGSADFTRRLNITMLCTGATRVNYPVYVNVTYDSDMTSTVFNDMRFYNGTTPINYWVETNTSSKWAGVWIQIPYCPNNANATISLCYGNATTFSTQNGVAVFTFFDDFEDGSYNTTRWTTQTGVPVESRGTLQLGAGSFVRVKSAIVFTTNYSVIWRNNYSISAKDYQGWIGSPIDSDYGIWFDVNQKLLRSKSAGIATDITYNGGWLADSVFGTYEAIRNNSKSNAFYHNHSFVGENWANIPTGDMILWFTNEGTDLNGNHLDWVAIRPFAYPEVVPAKLAEEGGATLNATLINLYLNGTESDITITYGQIVNITAKINTTGLNVELLKNSTLFNNDTTISFNITNINWFKNATYEITAQYGGNGSYSTTTVTRYIHVLKQSITLNLTINSTESDKTYTYPTVSNVSANLSISGLQSSITLLRNNTSITNPDIKTYGAYLYNFTAVFSHENYTAEIKTYWLTISKANSNLAVASSASWSVTTGDYTSLSCSVLSGLSISFTLDSNIISNPYTLQTQTGNYLVSCALTVDTYNYTPNVASNTIVVNPVLACTASNIYGFNKSITSDGYLTTLNFTDLVRQNYVRSNLGDVFVNINNTHYINTTNGYYFIVNNTGYFTFTVNFGNYYANRTYALNPLNESSIYNVSGYLQGYPVVIYNVLDELNGTAMYPPNTTLMSIITCDYGENYITVEDGETNFLLAVRGYLTKASLRVSYTADMYYSRQFYPNVSADLTIFNFYTIDAYKNALDRIDFKMLDTNYYNVKLQVYKSFGTTKLIITECYFDASHYCSAYLMEDSDYLLRTIDASNTITEFGTISVVKPDTKELGNVYIYLNPNAILIANNIYMNAYMSTDRKTLYVTYDDNLNLTQSLRLKIFFENGTTFQSLTYTTTNHLHVNFNTTLYNTSSFVVRFNITHSTLGNSPITYDLSLLAPVAWSLGTGVVMYNLISLGLLITVGGIGTKTSLIPSSIMLVVTYLILMGLGWITAPTVLLIVVIILLVLSIINHVRAGNET